MLRFVSFHITRKTILSKHSPWGHMSVYDDEDHPSCFFKHIYTYIVLISFVSHTTHHHNLAWMLGAVSTVFGWRCLRVSERKSHRCQTLNSNTKIISVCLCPGKTKDFPQTFQKIPILDTVSLLSHSGGINRFTKHQTIVFWTKYEYWVCWVCQVVAMLGCIFLRVFVARVFCAVYL